jgi:hypothetical protein
VKLFCLLAVFAENRDADPSKYGFRAFLKYSRSGRLSEKAISRLKSIVDQLPIIKRNPFRETLDGGVMIEIDMEKGKGIPELVLQTGIGPEDLAFDLSELQGFFLKVLKIVSNATRQLFSLGKGRDAINIVALNWNPPEPFLDPQYPEYIQKRIGRLFASFKLNLKLMIFYQPPEVPAARLRSFDKGKPAR